MTIDAVKITIEKLQATNAISRGNFSGFLAQEAKKANPIFKDSANNAARVASTWLVVINERKGIRYRPAANKNDLVSTRGRWTINKKKNTNVMLIAKYMCRVLNNKTFSGSIIMKPCKKR